MKGRKMFIGGIATLAAILIMVLGCGSVRSEETFGQGSLTLGVDEPVRMSMILPDGDNVTTYYIVGIEHDTTGDTLSEEISAAVGEVTFANILSGGYSIIVSGYNIGDELIGIGTGVVMVLPNDTSSTTITCAWVEGTGTVEIDYTLTPSDLVFSPTVEAQLGDGISWTPVTVTETAAGVWAYADTLDVGLYALATKLIS